MSIIEKYTQIKKNVENRDRVSGPAGAFIFALASLYSMTEAFQNPILGILLCLIYIPSTLGVVQHCINIRKKLKENIKYLDLHKQEYMDELNNLKIFEKSINESFNQSSFFIKNKTPTLTEVVIKIPSSVLFYRKDELGETVTQSFLDGSTVDLDSCYSKAVINIIKSELMKITELNIKKNREETIKEISSLFKISAQQESDIYSFQKRENQEHKIQIKK